MAWRTFLRVSSCGALFIAMGSEACSGGAGTEDVGSRRDALACVDAAASTATPAWVAGHAYAVNDRASFNGKIYQCILANTSTATTTPDKRPDLWVLPPSCALSEWQTQTGYNAGDVVDFNGNRYRALVANNSTLATTPGTTGGRSDWQLLSDISCPASDDSKFTIPDLPSPGVGAGTTPGTFSVSMDGAATYRVPIEVPPGRGSIAPQLAIAYSSSGGVGLFGLGTSLAGLSEIARCPSNLSDDKALREVRFDSSDALCLDGLRLVAVTAPGSTTEYRTQPDTFQKVIAYNSSDSSIGPLSFKVFSKDGRISEYGGRIDSVQNGTETSSRVMANGGVVARWELSRVSDRNGNYFDITYNNNRTLENDGDYTASFTPAKISYTGHLAADGTTSDMQPLRSVQFVYEHPRFTQVDYYQHGLHLFAPDLITRIDVSAPVGVVRSYSMVYDPGGPAQAALVTTITGRDRLESITESDGNGIKKDPTQFVYGTFGANPTFDAAFSFNRTDTQVARFDIPVDNSLGLPFNVVMDVDGNGVDDLISFTRQFSGSPDINNQIQNRLRIATQRTLATPGIVEDPWMELRDRRGRPASPNQAFDFLTGGDRTHPGTQVPITWTGNEVQEAVPLDYDGDGLRDLMIEAAPLFQGQPNELKWLKNTGGSFSAPQDTGIDLGLEATQHFPYFVDLNGDGALDFVGCNYGADSKDWQARLWQPSGFGDPVTIAALHGFPCSLAQALSNQPPGVVAQLSFQSQPSQFAAIDVNGDGVDELLVANGSSVDSPVFAVGWDWSANAFGAAVKTSLKLIDLTNYRELDLNGDGLLDIVEVRSLPTQADQVVGLKVLFNTGAGFVAGPDDTNAAYSVEELTEAVVLDANEDGRPDLLIPSPTDGTWDVLSWVSPTPNNGLTHAGFQKSPSSLLTGKSVKFSAARLGSPYNPEGVVWEDLTSETAIVFTNTTDSVPDLLTSVRDQPPANNIAGHIDGIRYSFLQSAHATTFSLPSGYVGDSGCTFPMICTRGFKSLVDRYGVTNGSGDQQDIQIAYRGAHFDALGRSWLGFSQVQMQFDSPTRVESWSFDNTTLDGDERFPRAGQLTDHWIVLDPSSPADASRNQLQYTREIRSNSNGASTFSYALTTRDDLRLTGAQIAADGSLTGTVVADTTSTFTPQLDSHGAPDPAGNLQAVTVTTAGLARKTVTTLQYGQENTDKWLVGLATDMKTVSTDRVAGKNVSQTRELQVTYDAQGRIGTEILAPGDGVHQLWTTLTRDAFGNITLSKKTGNEGGASVTREDCTGYDKQEASFPTVGGNSLGQITRTKYSGALGLPVQRLDVANNTLERLAYDGFGRLSQDVRPDQSGFSIDRSTVFATTGEGELSEHISDTTGSDLELRYDYAGRLVQRLTYRVGATSDPASRASESWTYDGLGQTSSHTFPQADATQPPLIESFSRDGLGRLSLVTRGGIPVESATYDGLEVHVKDGNGNQTTTTTDAAGRVVSVLDAKQGTTTHAYGPFDKLVSTIDPVGQTRAGHERSTTFDDYGFPIASNSPDRGDETFTYSAFGLVTHATAAGNVRDFTYDAIGRRASLVDGDGTTKWQWDTAPHGFGKLASVSGPDPSTVISYTYDDSSRPASISSQDSDGSSTVGFTYDDTQHHGRLSEVDYPDAAGAVGISYGYDARGNLVKLTDVQSGNLIWNWLAGDGANRVVQDSLSNGAISRTRTFDDQHEGAISTIHTTAGTRTLQNLSFGYDNDHNLTSRTDAGGWSLQGATAQSQTESFCYDGLDRLTDVDLGNVPCGGSEYHYAYDGDGNLLTKSGIGSYTYDPVHVHAAIAAGTGKYSYDGRGNQITRPRLPTDSSSLTGTPEVHYTSLDLPRAYLSGNITTWTADPTPQSPSGGLCPGEVAPSASSSDDPMPMACLIGSDSLTLNDGAVAHLDAATKSLELGVGAVLDGNASVAGDATLRDRSSITGTLTISGSVLPQNSFKVGAQVNVSSLTLPAIPTQTFMSGSGTLEVPNDSTRTLSPGSFGDATIRARSATTFTAGTYNFASLNIEPGTVIHFDTSAGPININVAASVNLQGPIDFGTATGNRVALYSNGCNVTISGAIQFPGTITAPHAQIITRNNAAIQGCVWGRQVELGPHQDAVVGASNPYCIVEDVGGKRQVTCSDNATSFSYDGTGARIAKKSATTKVRYVRQLYEQATDLKSGQVTSKYYVTSPAGPVAVLSKTRDLSGHVVGADSTQYILTDHQSSLDVLADVNGTTLDRRSYDPFGARRPPRPSLAASTASDPMLLGFGGHEDDPDIGLVNMNGRVYDPAMARFLSADPVVSAPNKSQGFNPYSYVFNNPLSWLDPSGFEASWVEPSLPGDDLTIVECDTCSAPPFFTVPEDSVSFANTLGWGAWSKVNAAPLGKLFDQAINHDLHTVAKGYIVAISWEVSAPATVFVVAFGLLDPNAANAPEPGVPTVPVQSGTSRVLQIAVPVVAGGIGAALGPRATIDPDAAQIDNLLNASENNVLRFAHGTSPASAESVVAGLNENAAAAASRGGTALERGSFFAHPLGPPSAPGEGLQLAYEWGLRHSPNPAVVIGELPMSVVNELIANEQLAVLPLEGSTLPQLVFSPSAFTTVNSSVTWIQVLHF